MPTFSTPNPIDLDLTVGIGYVEVNASDRADTVAEVTPSNPNRAGDISLARDSTIVFADGRLRVTVPKRLNLFGPGDSVDVRIDLPTGSRTVIDIAYGSIRGRGAFGASTIASAYGSVTLDSTDALRLKASYGEVEIAEVNGDLDLTVGHGKLHIDRIAGSARFKGSHGDIELGEVLGAVEGRASGSVTVGKAGGDVAIQTAYGNLRVREVTGGTVRLENGHANVHVGVPSGVAAWVDAASQHGVVRNELTPEGGPGSANTVELRLRVNYGDIVITRSQEGKK